MNVLIPRKVIQICGAGGGLFALCDDGTIWNFQQFTWAQIKALPEEVASSGTLG